MQVYFYEFKEKIKPGRYRHKFFKEKAELTMVDGYYNKKTNQDILPWHSDQAYGGAKTVKKLYHPIAFILNFFLFN